jgi:DinB family protein
MIVTGRRWSGPSLVRPSAFSREGRVVLTKSELISSLQKEVRLLLHLATKINAAALDYRPTPKQRSTIELLRYLTNMGPALLRYAQGDPLDATEMTAGIETANRRSFEETVTALAAHADLYASRLTDMPDEDMRQEIAGIDGSPTTRGAFLAHQVLGQCAAYRMQLFLYLKACGREELNTMNLWVGVDAPMPT